MPIVIDCCVAIAWAMEDESSDYADKVLTVVEKEGAVVPPIWPIGVRNVLLVAERKERITSQKTGEILKDLGSLPIHMDTESLHARHLTSLSIARATGLSYYDATYAELAQRLALPLATTDKVLVQAAKKLGITLYRA